MDLTFQPIVHAEHYTVEALEAQLRFEDPVLLGADQQRVVEVAREISLMDSLGDMVLEAACRQLAEWNTAHPDARPIELSVDVSDAQLRRPDFDFVVRDTIRRNRLDPAQLILELRELASASGPHEPATALERLAALGVQLSIGEFGAGRTSLTDIASLGTVDELKVDGALVGGANAHNVTVLLAAIGEVARGLGLTPRCGGCRDQRPAAGGGKRGGSAGSRPALCHTT